MATLTTHFEQFVKDRHYLQNVSDRTLEWYRLAFKQFTAAGHQDATERSAKAFVIGLRERGVKPVTCNNRARALNAFFVWLHREGHLEKPIRIPLQREERKMLQTFTEAQLRALIVFKPRNAGERRAHTLAMLLMDTGCRVDEALSLHVPDIDLDNVLLQVRGKGQKERIVPFSLVLRRVLFLWLKQRKDPLRSELVFPTRTGSKLSRRNATRAHYDLLARLGLPKCGFHRLRHTFATNYLRNGGDVVRLSRVLGHSQITTTMRYLHLQTEDLQKSHQQISMLERLSR